MRFYFFWVLSLILAQNLFANSPTNLDTFNKALSQHLETSSYWLKLLHFENNSSTINEKYFFLSKRGNSDAKAELKSTLQNFQEKPQTICTYPARYKFLNRHLALNIHAKCQELDAYLKKDYSKISLVFTASRYDSPSSMFGHTFLKVYSKGINYAINYAAKVPDKINSLRYAYEGIGGGFKAHYKLLSFNSKEYEYKNEEYRDLIEYTLTFNKEEVNNIMLHLFELREVSEDYYFLTRNCSSELLKLLDLANEKSHLQNALHIITIPIDIVYILDANKYISDISISSSKMKLFYELIESLNSDEKELLDQIVTYKIPVKTFERKSHLSFQAKKNITLAAINYLEMRDDNSDIQKNITTLFYLIKLRKKLHVSRQSARTTTLSQNPISNQFHKVSLATKFSRKSQKELSLAFRYTYKNQFDLMDAIEQQGSTEFFELALRSVESDTKQKDYNIDYFTLLNIEASPLSNSYFKHLNTKLTLGAKRLFYKDSLYSYLDYFLGYKEKITSNLAWSLHTKLGSYYYNEPLFSLGLQGNFQYRYHNHFLTQLQIESSYYTSKMRATTLRLNTIYKINHSSTLNVVLEHFQDTKSYNELMLKVNFFF